LRKSRHQRRIEGSIVMKKIKLGLNILTVIILITSCSRLNHNSGENNNTFATPAIETAASDENFTDNKKDVVIISDADSLSQPVKRVVERYGFIIEKIESDQENTYPVYYVHSSINNAKINDYRFLSDLAEVNEYCNYKIVESGNSIEVICDKAKKRVTKTKIEDEIIEYDNYDVDTAEEIALDLVIENQKLIYNRETDDYFQEGKTYTVLLKPYGFDARGRFEVRISPSYYPLSVINYCYVDLKNKTVAQSDNPTQNVLTTKEDDPVFNDNSDINERDDKSVRSQGNVKIGVFYVGMTYEEVLSMDLYNTDIQITSNYLIEENIDDWDYGHRVIWTQKLCCVFDETGKIYSITVNGDIPTDQCLKNGDSIDTVRDIYGKESCSYAFDWGEVLEYTFDDYYLSVSIQNNKVSLWRVSKYKYECAKQSLAVSVGENLTQEKASHPPVTVDLRPYW
jgi:hypothetical protein